jgi:hypothetical protein
MMNLGAIISYRRRTILLCCGVLSVTLMTYCFARRKTAAAELAVRPPEAPVALPAPTVNVPLEPSPAAFQILSSKKVLSDPITAAEPEFEIRCSRELAPTAPLEPVLAMPRAAVSPDMLRQSAQARAEAEEEEALAVLNASKPQQQKPATNPIIQNSSSNPNDIVPGAFAVLKPHLDEAKRKKQKLADDDLPDDGPGNPADAAAAQLQTAPVTEPTILPLDVRSMGRSARELAGQMAPEFSNWLVSNLNEENSFRGGVSFRGREQALVLKPINDKQAVRLSATIEVPEKFRPRLMFEVASGSPASDFELSAAIGDKTVLAHRTPWSEQSIDLGPQAGKRFELVISMLEKRRTRNDPIAIRNARLVYDKPKK